MRLITMRLITTTVAAIALGVVMTMPVVSDADAQNRTRARQAANDYPPGYYPTDRRPTRITVRRQRTYLDPGTEVQPLSRNYTDYAIPPGYFPSSRWDVTNDRRHPLPGAFELPFYP